MKEIASVCLIETLYYLRDNEGRLLLYNFFLYNIYRNCCQSIFFACQWPVYYCCDSKLRVKLRKEPYIGFTQENLIEFQVQSIYLIYTRLIVYAILNLAYPKEHVLTIKSTYSVYAI